MNPLELSAKARDERIERAVREILFRGKVEVRDFFLTPFAPESNSSLHNVVMGIKCGKKTLKLNLLVRGEFIDFNPTPQVMQRLAANYARRLNGAEHLKTWLYQFNEYTVNAENAERANVYKPRTVVIPKMQPGDIQIEIETLYDHTETFFSLFKTLQRQKRIDTECKQILQKLSEALHTLHSQRDIPVSFTPEGMTSLNKLGKKILARIYDDALTRWRAHFWDYVRPLSAEDEPHPVLTQKLERKFRNVMQLFMTRFAHRGDRVVVIHGDIWVPNILLTRAEGKILDVKFIDYCGTPPYFDRGFDLGRLLFDGVYWYYNTKNPVYLEWNDRLLAMHEERTKDQELRTTVCFGLISRLFIQLHPGIGRDFNRKRILWLSDVILDMAERGSYKMEAV